MIRLAKLFSLMLIATLSSSTLFAADGADQDAGHNEKLDFLAWMIGDWKREVASPTTGEPVKRNAESYEWALDGQAIRYEWQEFSAEGQPLDKGTGIFYIDSVDKEVKFWGMSARGIREAWTLASADDGKIEWRIRYTFPSGQQGYFKYTQRHKADAGRFLKGWLRISGGGPNEVGPWEFTRVETAEAGTREKTLAAYGKLVGHWANEDGGIMSLTRAGEGRFVWTLGSQPGILVSWDNTTGTLSGVAVGEKHGAAVNKTWLHDDNPTFKVENVYGGEMSATISLQGQNQWTWDAGEGKATVYTRLTAPRKLGMEWSKRFQGDWTYAWEGGFEEEGTATWKSEAKGKAHVAHFSPNGTEREVEVTGFQADTETWVSSGYSSNGGYWHIEWLGMTDESMRGRSHGVFPDGRAYTGQVTITRINENELAGEMEVLVDGETLKSTGKFLRK